MSTETPQSSQPAAADEETPFRTPEDIGDEAKAAAEAVLEELDSDLVVNASPEEPQVAESTSRQIPSELDHSAAATEDAEELVPQNPENGPHDAPEGRLVDSTEDVAADPSEYGVSEPAQGLAEDDEVVLVEFSADELDSDETSSAGSAGNESEDVGRPNLESQVPDVSLKTASAGRLKRILGFYRARPLFTGLTTAIALLTFTATGKLLNEVRDADRRISLANQERDAAVAAGQSVNDAAAKIRTQLEQERKSRQQAERERQAALNELEQIQRKLRSSGDPAQRKNQQTPAGTAHAEQLALLERERIAREVAERQARLASSRLRTAQLQTYNGQLDLVREVWQNNPVKAVMLLEDEERCPREFRDFTWRYYYRLSKRDRMTIDVHEAGVTAVCYSPDGTVLASADAGGAVELWNRATGMRITRLPERVEAVTSLVFSPDGSLLAAAGRDGAIAVWNMQTGALQETGSDPDGGILTLDFTPDGKQLASAGLSWSVRLWDVRGLRVRSTLVGHTANVTSVDFSPSGKMLASASQDGTIKLWNTKTKELSATRWGHRRTRESVLESAVVPGVWAVAFSPDGETLASGGPESIRLWNASSMRLRAETPEPAGRVKALAFSSDGSILASATDRHVRLWDSRSGRPQGAFKGHPTVTSLSFAPSGMALATAGDDGTIKIWNTQSTRDPTVATFGEPTEEVTAVAVSPLGDVLASSDGRTIRLRDLDAVRQRRFHLQAGGDAVVANGKGVQRPQAQSAPDGQIALLQGHSSQITALEFSTDGKTLASASADWPILLWDLASRRVRLALNGHTGGVTTMAFSADGRLFASGSEDKTVRLWDASTGRPIATLEGHPGSVLGVAFSPDGRTLASVGNDALIRLWNTEDATVESTLRTTGAAASRVAFSPDGRLLTAVVLDGEDKHPSRLPGSLPHAGWIELWDMESARLQATAPGNGRPGRSLQFSPDGKTLATADGEQVRLWDPRTGHERARLDSAVGEIASVAFTPDGNSLIAGGAQGIILWSTGTLAAQSRPVKAPRP